MSLGNYATFLKELGRYPDAEEKYGVPQLLDPTDDKCWEDENSMVTYLAEMMNHMPDWVEQPDPSEVARKYLDDAFPEVPLKPIDPFPRAQMRLWEKWSDDVGYAAVYIPTWDKLSRPVAEKLGDRSVLGTRGSIKEYSVGHLQLFALVPNL